MLTIEDIERHEHYRYKIELTSQERLLLLSILQRIEFKAEAKRYAENHELDISFIEMKLESAIIKIGTAIIHEPSAKKIKATTKATEVRTAKAKEKIYNAINLLRLENKEITHYSIATTSGVSYNTVKKHIPDLDKLGKM